MSNRFLLLSCVAIVLSGGMTSSKAADKPNIVFLFADDHGWNGTSAQMHPDRADSKSDYYETPNIERLARAGMRFSRGYAPSPNCSPSRMSLLTGMTPAKNGKTDIGGGRGPREHVKWLAAKNKPIELSETLTFPKLLRDKAGYVTAHFGKWHLPGDPGENGYVEHDGSRGNAGGANKNNPKFIFSLTKKGIDFMRKQVKVDKPFYLQISHFATHLSMQSRPSTYKKYEEKKKGKRHFNPLYGAMSEDLDTGIGMILDEIEKLGIADNTYVIYTADNGALRGEKDKSTSNDPLNKGKPTVWEGGIRVPFMIRGPGIAANSWSHHPVVGYDLYPTFCEWAGIESLVPSQVEGGSLVPTLVSEGKAKMKRQNPHLVFHFPHYVIKLGGKGKDTRPQSAIIMGDMKLVKIFEWDRPKLFALNHDIGEKKDIWNKMPEKGAEMHKTLQEYLKSVDAQMPKFNKDWDMTVEEWYASNKKKKTKKKKTPEEKTARKKRKAEEESKFK